MRSRRKSPFERVIDLIPAVFVVGAGAAAAALAMSIVITAPPIVAPTTLVATSTPAAGPTFAATPSLLPFASIGATDTPAPVASLSDHVPRFVHSVIKDSDPGGVWTVYLSYPAFITGETPWAVQIDTDIRADLKARLGQWESGTAAHRWAKGRVNTFTGTFNTELVTSTIASWTYIIVDDSTAQGPATTLDTLNYDLATGQRFTLDDIFIDATSVISVISGLAPGLLRPVLGTAYVESVVDEGTSPLLTNYNNWAITRTGLRITFNQYQVALAGPTLPTIVVPWSALRSVMNTTGPVAAMAGIS
jgi:hypothetical protein